jgi:outer membrane protein with beta-barrel domain
MKHLASVMFVVFAAATPLAFAQKWEVGVAGGGTFSTSQSVKNAIGNADAGFANGYVVSAWLGNNTGNVVGGELRYDYEHSDLKLSSGGTQVNFGAQAHAIHYDVLLHFAPSESPMRPFIAAGAGVKYFTGTGTEQAFQPLSNIALLTKTNQIEPMVSVGGGVKFNLGRSAHLRLEAHDYLTPFPKNVIAPAQGSQIGGWLQDFVISAGISFPF